MTVESDYMIAIATLSDWLKRLAVEKTARPSLAPITSDKRG